MIYLGNLNKVDTLKGLTPPLIYYICFRGKPSKFKAPPLIIDIEQDCKALYEKRCFYEYQRQEQ